MKIGSDYIYTGTRWGWAFGQWVKIIGIIRGDKYLTQAELDETGLNDSDVIEFAPYVETEGGRVASFITSDAAPADFAELLELPF